MELGSVAVIGVALAFVGLMWLRGWWSRTSRVVVTVPIVVFLVLPLVQEQLRSGPPPATSVGMPTEYADAYTPLRGSGMGSSGQDLFRTTGPGTLYVAFTCRGDGHVAVRLGLDSEVRVGQDCVPGETRELREWIEVDGPREITVQWASPDDVRRNYVIQFLESVLVTNTAG